MNTFKQQVLLEFTKIALTDRFESYFVPGSETSEIFKEILTDAEVLYNMIEEKVNNDGKNRQSKKSDNHPG